MRRANLVGVVLDTEEEKEEESLEQSWERMQASLAAGKAQRLAVDFSIDDCLSHTGGARLLQSAARLGRRRLADDLDEARCGGARLVPSGAAAARRGR